MRIPDELEAKIENEINNNSSLLTEKNKKQTN